jgi:aryl-alcohol dehydrogenase-like predicted oxidoreductase
LIHEPDPDTPMEETLVAFDDLVRAGKVLHIGASNIEAWRLAVARGISDRRGLARFEWTQNSYSLLDRFAEREMLPLCADQHIGFTAFSPLAGGWLTGKYRSGQAYPAESRMTMRPEPYAHLTEARVFAALDALGSLARDRGVEMSALALAWLLQQPGLTAAVIGPRNPSHLDAALAALDITLTPGECAAITSCFDD